METELFRGVVPFVAVAEEGSFRRAAVRLGVSVAAVSKAVRSLEERVGQTLLARTSRTVALTGEGAAFFERCRPALAAVRSAHEALRTGKEPKGSLVIAAPFIAMPLLIPALGLLRERYPALTFQVRVGDQLSRLAEESVDVAVRVGVLPASSLISRRLRRTRMLTVASPGYLARRGTPRTPRDLVGHDCLVGLSPERKARPWLFARGPVVVAPVLLVDHGPSLVDAARAGLGIGQAFDFMVSDELARGELVQVLESSTANGPDIHAVCAPGRRASANVRAAFEALADAFRPAA